MRLDERTTTHHNAPHKQMSEPKKSTGVRLSDEQIAGLKSEAARLTREFGMKVGWTTLVSRSVDKFIANRKTKRARSAKAELQAA